MTQSNTAIPLHDEGAAEAFAGRICEVLDCGALAAMITLGHRGGLFEILAGLAPSTSEEIAAASGLSERYLREWLAAMVTGGVLRYDPTRRTYQLPAEHAACLTRGAPLGNLAVYAQSVVMFGAVQDRVLACFASGGGTTYDDYPCFHSMMAEDSEQTVVLRLFDTILPLAPGLEERLERGIDVLDAGCGVGRALIAMAGRHLPDALHADLARPGRRRSRHHVGLGDRRADAEAGRLRDRRANRLPP